MGKVETIKIWPISSTEMLNEELYKYKGPYKLYAKIVKMNNSQKKKKKQNVYVKFRQISTEENRKT